MSDCPWCQHEVTKEETVLSKEGAAYHSWCLADAEKDELYQRIAALESQLAGAQTVEQDLRYDLGHTGARLDQAEERIAELEEQLAAAQKELQKAKNQHNFEANAMQSAEVGHLLERLEAAENKPVGHRKKDCLCRFCAAPTQNLMTGEYTEHPAFADLRKQFAAHVQTIRERDAEIASAHDGIAHWTAKCNEIETQLSEQLREREEQLAKIIKICDERYSFPSLERCINDICDVALDKPTAEEDK